jgi:hypothetical protein
MFGVEDDEIAELRAQRDHWETRFNEEKEKVSKLTSDLKDERNDCVQDQQYITQLLAKIEVLKNFNTMEHALPVMAHQPTPDLEMEVQRKIELLREMQLEKAGGAAKSFAETHDRDCKWVHCPNRTVMRTSFMAGVDYFIKEESKDGLVV